MNDYRFLHRPGTAIWYLVSLMESNHVLCLFRAQAARMARHRNEGRDGVFG